MIFTGKEEILKHVQVGDVVTSVENKYGHDGFSGGRQVVVSNIVNDVIYFDGCSHDLIDSGSLTIVSTPEPRFVDVSEAATPAQLAPRFLVAWDRSGGDPARFFPTFKAAKAYADEIADDKSNSNIRIAQIAKLWAATRKVTAVVKLQPLGK